jgi:hypothetical protein
LCFLIFLRVAEQEKKRLEGEMQARLFEEARLKHEQEVAEAKRAAEERYT